MANLKSISKEISNRENRNLQRAIVIWWTLSLCACVVLVESITLLAISVASFVLASKCLSYSDGSKE